MEIRDAKIKDVQAITELIASYAELDKMLFRSPAEVYENLQIFKVAEDDGRIVGCCALQVIWDSLAEIKSLAVSEDYSGRGAGSELVRACLDSARRLGVEEVFALTLEPVFFEKLSFKRVDRNSLPMKVWSDCAKCPKQDHCDEIALIYTLKDSKFPR